MKPSYLPLILSSLVSLNLWADAKVTFPGDGYGQLVYISAKDLEKESLKYKSLSPITIPVFEELPHDLTVVAGTIAMKEVTINSHIHLKAKARRTPNLDISELEGGMKNKIFHGVKDGDWIHLKLGRNGEISVEDSTKEAAIAAYKSRKTSKVTLIANTDVQTIFTASELGWKDYDKVGSKASNYAELIKALNTPEREVVRPSYAIPFYYYVEFLKLNPLIQEEIDDLLQDPMVLDVSQSQYRNDRLASIRKMMMDPKAKMGTIAADLVDVFDKVVSAKGKKRKMKLRSSTNSEDLPNFNGAGLYDSAAYKPNTKTASKDIEKSREEKEASVKEALQLVWASVWHLRAFDERAYFNIPHDQVRMGIQINPSFGDEYVDGVVVTRNVSNNSLNTGDGVYIEAQRGDFHSVTKPQAGAKTQKILVNIDRKDPLNKDKYKINILQNSNIGDDNIEVLTQDNLSPVMLNDEIIDLTYQSLKAEAHFRPLHGKGNPDFALDLEFKVDEGTKKNSRQVYLKQARPYIE